MTLGRPNFTLQEHGWGNCRPIDIKMTLESTRFEFYKNLDQLLIPSKPVIISPSPNSIPDIIKQPQFDLIRLSSRHSYYAQHSYQFAHELCHHVVDSDFFGKIDTFGWLEESLCELASIFTLEEMAVSWSLNPPWPNWASYSTALKDYAEGIKGDESTKIQIPFKKWLSDRIAILSKDRVRRTDNRVVALQLHPLFKANPPLWKVLQYINQVPVTNETTFIQFVEMWRETLPNDLRFEFTKVAEALSV